MPFSLLKWTEMVQMSLKIPHLKPLTHLSIKHLVISLDYTHEFIWAHSYRYVFREFISISAVLIRTSHPHCRRAILLLAALEKLQKAKLTRTMKAKLLVHFPQKVYYSCTKKQGFTIYKYTHILSNSPLRINSKLMSQMIPSNPS